MYLSIIWQGILMGKKLFFREDGRFRLMQLTDIHYTQEDPAADSRTIALMREMIRAEQPDFIMITGDTVYGPRAAELLKPALEPVLESGVPWCFAFGNHD